MHLMFIMFMIFLMFMVNMVFLIFMVFLIYMVVMVEAAAAVVVVVIYAGGYRSNNCLPAEPALLVCDDTQAVIRAWMLIFFGLGGRGSVGWIGTDAM